MYVYVTTCKCRVVELVRPVYMFVSRCCLSVCVIACRCTVLESFRSVCVCVCVCVCLNGLIDDKKRSVVPTVQSKCVCVCVYVESRLCFAWSCVCFV